jgi:transposase
MTPHVSTTTDTLWVAIDVAKMFHQALLEYPNGRRRTLRVANSKAALDGFVALLRESGLVCQVAFEATGDYHRPLAYHLGAAGCALHLVSSVAVARTREARYNSWDKNDPKDTQVILHLLKTGTTQQYVDPLQTGYQDLLELAQTYQQISLRKTRLYHSLVTHYLPLYFPEAERYLASSRAAWWVQVMRLAPCPRAVLAYSKAAFIAAAWSLPGVKTDKNRWLGDFYETAKSSVGLPVAPDSAAVRMFQLVLDEYGHLSELRARFERDVVTALAGHPDFVRLRTIPGIGPILALIILAESRDLRRFRHYRQFLKYCGFDLCTSQSGQSRGLTHLSKRGNARLRYAFWLAATVAIRMRQNSFRRKYEACIKTDPLDRDRCRKAYTAVAAKMARVAYALIKTGTDYHRFVEAAPPGGGTRSHGAVEAFATS